MGVFPFEVEHQSSVPAAVFFKVLVFDAPTVFPKIVEAIKSIEFHDGNGDVGTIKKMNVVEGGKARYLKQKVEVVDKDNFVYNFTTLESDTFPDYFEKISYEHKLTPTPNGTNVKVTIKFFTKGDAQLKEEDGKNRTEKSEGLLKTVEAYLLANPNN